MRGGGGGGGGGIGSKEYQGQIIHNSFGNPTKIPYTVRAMIHTYLQLKVCCMLTLENP